MMTEFKCLGELSLKLSIFFLLHMVFWQGTNHAEFSLMAISTSLEAMVVLSMKSVVFF